MTASEDDAPGDLAALTGLRSGKRSYYPEYIRSAERLENAVQALDGISRALVRTAAGPRTLVEWVVRTATEHLRAEWLLFAMADGVLPAARPRFLAVTGGALIDDESLLPADVREHLDLLRGRPWEAESPDSGHGWVRVSMTLDEEPVGGIAARPGSGLEVAATDQAILRVLANQAAVALHNSFLFHATTQLRGRSEQLYDATTQHARDLAARSAELAETQRQLVAALQRQALDDERHRIARELHDSVTQSVLSVGMTIEVCRAELESLGGQAGEIAARLSPARDLTRHAAEQLRAAIYSLHHVADEASGPLPVMLRRLSTVHRPAGLQVTVVPEGRPVPLPAACEQAMLRWTGEALFNAAAHGKATRARVRLRYRADAAIISVSDNGTGDPAQLRRALRLSSTGDLSGRHRGLANMLEMASELGGTLSIRGSRSGGILLQLSVPLPWPGGGSGGRRSPAEGDGGHA
ncbi:MAG: MadS family sensor histidine kinase [Streptosporangiaceae bacterium]|nr:sensor histidine kinase [Actinomycetota bacterium]